MSIEDWTLFKGERNMNSGSQNKSNFCQNWRNTDFPKLGQLVLENVTEKPLPAPLWCRCDPRSPLNSDFICVGQLSHQKPPLSSTFHWAEAHQRFRTRSQGVTAAVSVFVKLNKNQNKYWDGNAVYCWSFSTSKPCLFGLLGQWGSNKLLVLESILLF